jgi:4-amino-4-deoxy-L-arabinose transferase-like glycosyltransferase
MPSEERPSAADLVPAASVGAISFALYVRTLAPGLLQDDSGEFQTLARLAGHSHPTNYPVYLALARAFSWLPFRDVAYRVNLLSATLAAIAVACVYLAVRSLAAPRGAALVAASALAVAPAIWSQAVIAEVYSAAAASLALILLLLLRWRVHGRPGALFAAGLLGGMSLGVHLSVALAAPAVLAFLWLHRQRARAVFRPAIAGAAAGVAVTLALFALNDWNASPASYFDTVVVPSRSQWGLDADAIDDPWERLYFGWSAKQFRHLMFVEPITHIHQRAGAYLEKLPVELSHPILILAALGAVAILVRQPRAAVLPLGALMGQWLFTFNYDVQDLYVFFIPGYVLLAVLAGTGLGALMAVPARLGAFGPRGRARASAVLAAGFLGGGLLPIAAPRLADIRTGTFTFEAPYYPLQRAHGHALHSDARAAVRGLAAGALVVMSWDMLYPFYYVAQLDERRDDLRFVAVSRAASFDALLLASASARPVLAEDAVAKHFVGRCRTESVRAGALLFHRIWPETCGPRPRPERR